MLSKEIFSNAFLCWKNAFGQHSLFAESSQLQFVFDKPDKQLNLGSLGLGPLKNCKNDLDDQTWQELE